MTPQSVERATQKESLPKDSEEPRKRPMSDAESGEGRIRELEKEVLD
jgi:hypothetical protein